MAVILFLAKFALTSPRFSVYQETILALVTPAEGLLLMVVTMALTWLVGGLAAALVIWSFAPFFLLYDIYIAAACTVSVLTSFFVGMLFNRTFFYLEQRHNFQTDKVDEGVNILKEEVDRNNAEILHLERRLRRYTELNEITEQFSSTLNEDEITKIVVDNIHRLFGKADRVLLFRVDAEDQELRLVYSKRIGIVPYVRLKKGDIFDRWVVWKKQPLMVENTRTDFRFSLVDDNIDRDFASLIAAPLVSGDKILGLVRTDSKKPYFYSQEDLRLLDIVADLASIAIENAILYRRLNDMAVHDGLTLLYVQKFFKESLDLEVQRFLKSGAGFSLVLFDIDNFKNYNDRYGHMVGDLVLRHIASVLMKEVKPGDVAARYGGEEFAILLLGKDKGEAVRFAELLQSVLTENPAVFRREKTPITISIGIASCPEDSKLADDLFRCADRRLYKAKEKGKNRICAS